MVLFFQNGKASKRIERSISIFSKNTEKYITFSVLIKNDEKITDRLLIALGLCQPHYQILLIIFLKDLIIINAQVVSLTLTACQSKLIN